MLDLENEIAKAAVAGVHYYIAGDKKYVDFIRLQ